MLLKIIMAVYAKFFYHLQDKIFYVWKFFARNFGYSPDPGVYFVS